jgi:hypothetical protein
VRESQITEHWRESFNKFMFGSTCLVELNSDESFKEFIYYSWDFKRWYNQNKIEIERDKKINKIIRN